MAVGHDRSGRRHSCDLRCRGRCAGCDASGCGFVTCSTSGAATCYLHFVFERASGPATARVSGSQWFHRRVAGSRCVPLLLLGDIYEPNGLAVCNVEQSRRYGSILLRGDPWSRSSGEPGLRGGLQGIFRPEKASRHRQAQRQALGIRQKVILGAGGKLMGGDQITCGVQDVVVACMLIRGFRQNHGDDTAQRHGFVLDPQRSWTF